MWHGHPRMAMTRTAWHQLTPDPARRDLLIGPRGRTIAAPNPSAVMASSTHRNGIPGPMESKFRRIPAPADGGGFGPLSLVMAKGDAPPGSRGTFDLSIHPGEVVLAINGPIGWRPDHPCSTLVGDCVRFKVRASAGAWVQALKGIEPGPAPAALRPPDRHDFPGPQLLRVCLSAEQTCSGSDLLPV